jgi:ABC-type uncharacterized transport system involved in gliding motility auxiliary subunit
MIMNRPGLFTAAALVLGAILLVAVNLLSATLFTSSRIDLTEHRLYTLSEGTRNVLRSLEEPVTLRLFLSRDLATRLPGISTYASRVEDLLREFDRIADENLTLELIDPLPFSEEEDLALAYGLEGIPLDTAEGLFYFGLVASGPTGEQEVIPFLSMAREQYLEYDLARLVHQVAEPDPPVVGLLSALPIHGMVPGGAGLMGGMSQPSSRPWIILDQIEQFFTVRQLPLDSQRIPDDIDVLMLVDPDSMEPEVLYAVDQYMLSGGRAVVFVDGYREGAQTGLPGIAPGDQTFAPILRQWGLQLRPDAVAADINLASRVRTLVNERNVIIDYPVWLNLLPQLYDDSDIVTSELGDVVMASPGVLDVLGDNDLEITPLISTTDSATTVDPARLGPGSDLTALVRDYQGGGEALMLVARVSGNFASAFPNRPPTTGAADDPASESRNINGDPAAATTDDSSDDKTAHLSQSTASGSVIVFSDTDMLRDEFWVTTQQLLGSEILIPTSANNTLVINALENLSGDDNLISIRSRAGHSRPFTLLDEVRREAELGALQKEQELLDELERTEQRLAQRQQQANADGMILGAEQALEVDRFREQLIRIRSELRAVRRNLREDIDAIESWVKFVNIALVPICVGIGGMAFAFYRMHGRRRRHA